MVQAFHLAIFSLLRFLLHTDIQIEMVWRSQSFQSDNDPEIPEVTVVDRAEH